MGPLTGLKIIEIGAIGPVPFCGMLLSDMGADVLRVDRTAASGLGISQRESRFEVLGRGRRSLAVDLKNAKGVETLLRLCTSADALMEGFRPGVAERLGIGPKECMERNVKLIYGRMTGWGQDGPISKAAGHDINYISLSGVLHAIGTKDSGPVPPLNLTGDFGGGAMFLAFGLMAAIWEARNSGKGQIIDTSMVEGSAYLQAAIYGMHAAGTWSNERGTNILDTGAPYYNVYETKDGKHVSIGSIETKFYEELIEKSGLRDENLPSQNNREKWPDMTAKFSTIFAQKTRAEWCAIMEGSDICFAPVLSMAEAPDHPQNKYRKSFLDIDGVTQPAPTPKFSRTKPEVTRNPPKLGEHTKEGLSDWGLSEEEIRTLLNDGAIAQN